MKGFHTLVKGKTLGAYKDEHMARSFTIGCKRGVLLALNELQENGLIRAGDAEILFKLFDEIETKEGDFDA